MNITSKSRYALKIMMDLAYHRHLPHVHRRDIAARQGIPPDYLDQIMLRLRRGHLVESVRGRGGGYKLARAAGAISLWDLFSKVEESVYPVECLDHSDACDFEVACAAKPAWDEIVKKMRDVLRDVSLESLVEKHAKPELMCPVGGTRECRAPRVTLKENERKHDTKKRPGHNVTPPSERALVTPL